MRLAPKKVVVLVPRRAGIEDRDRIWEWVRAWWVGSFPDWTVVEGHHDIGPFNRAAAINNAAELGGAWDAAIIIDADVVIDPAPVRAAVDLAAAADRMVLAYHERIHLTQRASERIMGGYQGNWLGSGMVAKRLLDSCSSAVAVSRALWDEVGGFDERFSGWGWEDVGFRCACETMAGAEMGKIAGTLFHLHHRTSHENNEREPTFQRNRARGDLYRAARFDEEAMRALLDEPVAADTIVMPELEPSRIPRILHRTVPAEPSAEADAFWAHWRQLLPGWELMNHQDPLDPRFYPELSDLWPMCKNGAQLAGLIRLDALWTWGGVYVDSDVEPYRSLEPLVHLNGFAAFEDAKVIPDAVLGFTPNHPAVRLMIDRAREVIEDGGDAWASGPGVSTAVLGARRHDVLVLPPGSFYPYHYTEKNRRRVDHFVEQPWAFGAHHWAGSWLTPEQVRAQARRRR